MSASQRFKVKIPAGYRIFYPSFEIAGTSMRRAEIAAALNGRNLELLLEPEPDNKHDRNAIKIMARTKGWILTSTRHIGYVPRDLARVICERGGVKSLLVRPHEVWVGDRGGLKFEVDLLGPKDAYNDHFES